MPFMPSDLTVVEHGTRTHEKVALQSFCPSTRGSLYLKFPP